MLAEMSGVGQVFVGGSALPAVRVDVHPTLLNNMGLNLEDVRNALASANVNHPKGQVTGADHTWTLAATDQLMKADQYKSLIVAIRNRAPVRLAVPGQSVALSANPQSAHGLHRALDQSLRRRLGSRRPRHLLDNAPDGAVNVPFAQMKSPGVTSRGFAMIR